MFSTVGSPGKLARKPSSVTVVVCQSWAESGMATASVTAVSGIKRMASPISTALGHHDVAESARRRQQRRDARGCACPQRAAANVVYPYYQRARLRRAIA